MTKDNKNGSDSVQYAPTQAKQSGEGGQQSPQARKATLAQYQQPSEPIDKSAAKSKSDEESMIGQIIAGKYRIKEHIGKGGVGTVFGAEHIDLPQEVAIKFPNLKTQEPDIVERFVLEARSLALIKHENVVRVTDIGTTDEGRIYLIMERLEGRTMDDIIRNEGALPLDRAIGIMLQICRGLGRAHDLGIIHRDMKPGNVMLVPEYFGKKNVVKIFDFGIAKDIRGGQKTTAIGSTLGTPEYMSPEQCQGSSDIDLRTDVYAVGIIFYEMLCGKVPLTGTNFLEICRKQIDNEVIAPSLARPDLRLPPEVDDVILRALDKKKENRFGSMEEFAAALMAIPTVANENTAVQFMPEAYAAAQQEEEVPVIEETREEHKPDTLRVEIEPEKPKGKRGLIVALAVAVAAAATGVILVDHYSRAAKSQKTPITIVSSDASVSDSAPRVMQDARVDAEKKKEKTYRIRLVSEPAGVSVMQSKNIVGTTPYEFDLLEGSGKAVFTLKKKGYKEETVEIIPDGNKEINRKLVREHLKSNGTKGKPKIDISKVLPLPPSRTDPKKPSPRKP